MFIQKIYITKSPFLSSPLQFLSIITRHSFYMEHAMLARVKSYNNLLYSILIGLFFILALPLKISYSLIQILLAVSGIVLLVPHIKSRTFNLDKADKWLIASFVFYFTLCVISFMTHKGKFSELDLPSRAVLTLPILAVLYKKHIQQVWILYAILAGGIVAGVVSIIQVFGFDLDKPFPKTMHIQAGDMAMSLAMFSFCALFYFHAQKQRLLTVTCLISGLLAMIASFLTTARGAWIGVPAVLAAIFLLNRKNLSKWVVTSVLLITLSGGFFAKETIYQRYLEAKSDISAYVDRSNTSTSVGARFDMWKSSLLGIQEKPLFGWGLEGVKEMRKQHFEQGKISQYASGFAHAHNQYLHDTATRGVLGLIALLAILFVPLSSFWRNVRQAAPNSLAHLWGVLGITHILLMMSYFLTQAFLSHNSGVMFYFTVTLIFLGLQKTAQNQPLVGTQ